MSITFDGCTGFPCIVHHGQTATGQLTMQASAATDTLTCKVGYCCIVSVSSSEVFKRLLVLSLVGLSSRSMAAQ